MTNILASTMVSRGIKHLAFIALMTLSCALSSQGQDCDWLLEGDLIFCCSDSANVITDVTRGFDLLPIDHVAIVHRIGGDDGPLYVIEAIKPAVCLTPIRDFVQANSRMIVGRVVADVDVTQSVRRCLLMVGKPYDDLYLPGDSAIYCSELVQSGFVDSRGHLVFDTIPMSFHDESGKVTDYWTDFYRQRGMDVPEGAPGTNPGELSRRHEVSIIGDFKGCID